MISIKKLSAGQTVWDIRKGQRFVSKWSHWPVRIVEVNIDEGWVLASRNNNPASKIWADRNGKFNWFKERKE